MKKINQQRAHLKKRDDKARKEMAKKIVTEEVKECLDSQPLTL